MVKSTVIPFKGGNSPDTGEQYKIFVKALDTAISLYPTLSDLIAHGKTGKGFKVTDAANLNSLYSIIFLVLSDEAQARVIRHDKTIQQNGWLLWMFLKDQYGPERPANQAQNISLLLSFTFDSSKPLSDQFHKFFALYSNLDSTVYNFQFLTTMLHRILPPAHLDRLEATINSITDKSWESLAAALDTSARRYDSNIHAQTSVSSAVVLPMTTGPARPTSNSTKSDTPQGCFPECVWTKRPCTHCHVQYHCKADCVNYAKSVIANYEAKKDQHQQRNKSQTGRHYTPQPTPGKPRHDGAKNSSSTARPKTTAPLVIGSMDNSSDPLLMVAPQGPSAQGFPSTAYRVMAMTIRPSTSMLDNVCSMSPPPSFSPTTCLPLTSDTVALDPVQVRAYLDTMSEISAVDNKYRQYLQNFRSTNVQLTGAGTQKCLGMGTLRFSVMDSSTTQPRTVVLHDVFLTDNLAGGRIECLLQFSKFEDSGASLCKNNVQFESGEIWQTHRDNKLPYIP